MPTIGREDINSVNAILTVKVEPADYSDNIKDALKDLRKKSNMKGFRAGKVPMSMILKMHGKKVVFDEVNKVVNREVGEYIDTLDEVLIGQPIPTAEEILYDFSVEGMKKGYTFQFRLGFQPKFDLKGYSQEATLDYYDIKLAEGATDKEVENIKKQNGETTHPEEGFVETDVLTVELKELDGDIAKEGGVTNTTDVAIDLLPEALRAEVLTMKKGDTFTVNIYEMDSKMSEESDIRKYVLGIEEEVQFGAMFSATIENARRILPGELNEELFNKLFPSGEVTDEAGLRAKIEDSMLSHYREQADKLFLAFFQRHLLATNVIELPEDFLKESLSFGEDVSEEMLEREFPAYIRSLTWSMLQSKIMEIENLEVSHEDIKKRVVESSRQYFGGAMDDAFLEDMANRILEDKKVFNREADELVNDMITKAGKDAVALNIKTVTVEEFEAVIKAYNEQLKAEEGPVEDFEEVTEEALIEDATIEG